MENIFKFADESGPLKVIHVYEPSVNIEAVLVVDNIARGPSIGGVRMAADVSTEECMRLARKKEKVLSMKGPRMLIALPPCPTGRDYDPQETVTLGKLAVKPGIWPL